MAGQQAQVGAGGDGAQHGVDLAEQALGLGGKGPVVDVAGRGDDDARAPVVAVAPVEDLLARHGADQLMRAEDGTAQRMLAEACRLREIEEAAQDIEGVVDEGLTWRLRKATEAVGGTLPELHYACSLLISRKTYNLDSYRLNQVAYAVGHEEFDHHDALADSDACARIIIHAANRKDADDLAGLLAATNQKLKPVVQPAAE